MDGASRDDRRSKPRQHPRPASNRRLGSRPTPSKLVPRQRLPEVRVVLRGVSDLSPEDAVNVLIRHARLSRHEARAHTLEARAGGQPVIVAAHRELAELVHVTLRAHGLKADLVSDESVAEAE